MIKEFKVPSPGESITEVEIAKWLVEDGAIVSKNDEVAEVESDKATLMMVADESGKISIKVAENETISVGAVAFTIDTSFEPVAKEKVKVENKDVKQEEDIPDDNTFKSQSGNKEVKPEERSEELEIKATPLAQKMMDVNGLSVDDIIKGLSKITSKEVEMVINEPSLLLDEDKKTNSREVERNKMSMLRRKLSERLVKVKNETAMLTTFNEIDMKPVMDLRKKNQDAFVKKHGIKLGFMALFTKAVAIATQHFPMVNSHIDGEEILTPEYADVGIAVQSPKGLMVPVVRNAESKTVPEIELEIKNLAEKARNKTITMDELSGGTISITNGGVFGSLMSTPIINPPQSAILGMHNIVERPVAINGNVEIRPMMYVALSYDHRIIDGKDSVGFLVKIKELIEKPELMLTGGNDMAAKLLSL